MVSVVIPTFNRAAKLRECIESVLNQSYSNLEIVVVDDGSTDDTGKIVEALQQADQRIRYLYQKNSGRPSIARNLALENSGGCYVQFIDDDDMMAPGALLRAVTFLEENNDVSSVFADWMMCHDDPEHGRVVQPSLIKKTGYMESLPPEVIDRKGNGAVVYNYRLAPDLIYSNIVKLSTIMVRRKVLDRVGHFDETMTIGEDSDLWLRLCRHKMAYLQEPACYVRRHESNITADVLRNYKEDRRVYEKFLASVPIDFDSPDGQRLLERISTFYFDGAWHLYQAEKVKEAQNWAFKAAKLKPSARTLRMAAVLSVPLAALLIGRLYKVRRRLQEV